MSINLVPLEGVKPPSLKFLVEGLEKIFPSKVQVIEPLPLPHEAYNFLRGKYLSTRILRRLKPSLKLGPGEKALLIADVDLYAEGLNFVFGEAEISGSVAIISLTRLRESYYNRPENPELFESRALKEAVHELGHVFGLRHCPRPDCVMHFSNSLEDTDRKGANFCPQCRAFLPGPGYES